MLSWHFTVKVIYTLLFSLSLIRVLSTHKSVRFLIRLEHEWPNISPWKSPCFLLKYHEGGIIHISNFSDALIKHHDKGKLRKMNALWLLIPNEECLEMVKACQQAAGTGTQRSHLHPQVQSIDNKLKVGQRWSLKFHPLSLNSSRKTAPLFLTAPPTKTKHSKIPNVEGHSNNHILYPFFS